MVLDMVGFLDDERAGPGKDASPDAQSRDTEPEKFAGLVDAGVMALSIHALLKPVEGVPLSGR